MLDELAKKHKVFNQQESDSLRGGNGDGDDDPIYEDGTNG